MSHVLIKKEYKWTRRTLIWDSFRHHTDRDIAKQMLDLGLEISDTYHKNERALVNIHAALQETIELAFRTTIQKSRQSCLPTDKILLRNLMITYWLHSSVRGLADHAAAASQQYQAKPDDIAWNDDAQYADFFSTQMNRYVDSSFKIPQISRSRIHLFTAMVFVACNLMPPTKSLVKIARSLKPAG